MDVEPVVVNEKNHKEKGVVLSEEEKEKRRKKEELWKKKKYLCQVKLIDIRTGKNIIVLNEEDATENDIYTGYRVILKHGEREIICLVDLSTEMVKKGEIGIFRDVAEKLKVKDGDILHIMHMEKPLSVEFIKQKLDGGSLTGKQIATITQELMKNQLSEIELASFIAGIYTRGIGEDETVALTEAIANSGERLDLGVSPVADKHCISGDVPVMVKNSGNSKVRDIGEIVDAVFERCGEGEIEEEDGAEFTSKNLRGLRVPTFDGKGNVAYEKVAGVFRVPSPPTLQEIVLRGNRRIRVTGDHTIFTLKEGRIKNIRAREIRDGDFVLVPLGMERGGCARKSLGREKIGISPEFMRLLGYYISEGFRNYQGIFLNFGSHEKGLIRDSAECIEKVFGKKPTINRAHETATRVCAYSQEISRFFGESVRAGDSALEKGIPPFVFDLEAGLVMEFLRALLRGDGYTRRGYEAIYVTSSRRLANDLAYLLSAMGISANISMAKGAQRQFPKKKSETRDAYYVYTQAREIFGGRKKANVAFINLLPIMHLGEIKKERIGWKMRKALKGQRYITREKLRRIEGEISSPDVKKILNGRLGVLEVKSNRRVESKHKYVYDFKMESHHRFMAGSAPMFVHNCIGGVAGNRTTMVVVPIVAAAGIYIPKSSSRAITSAAGTADTMEVLADVNFRIEELREITLKAKGAMVWGGGMNIAAADDKLIKIRHPLSLDPRGMLLASILAKKSAVGAKYVVIDIPIGRGAKVLDMEKAEGLGGDFIKIGKRMDMTVESLITDGAEPVGNGVGCALECRDVMEVLKGKGPEDLRNKSTLIAGKILELVGKVAEGDGKDVAEQMLYNGKAWGKMKEIIELQGGNPAVKESDLPIGGHTHTITATRSGKISHIDNKGINRIARAAGAPKDKGAGVYLHRLKGDKVKEGDVLFDIYAESETKLDFAIKAVDVWQPVELEKFLLGTMR